MGNVNIEGKAQALATTRKTTLKFMNILINQDGIKREISGPFEVCISKKDRDVLVKCLSKKDDFVYGWIKIFDEPEIVHYSNTPAIPWNR